MMVSSLEIARTALESRYGGGNWGPSAVPGIDRLLARPVFLKVASGDKGAQLLT